MALIPTRLGEVAYRMQGQGTPVVLLHATLHDSHDFDAVIPRLAEQYQVIAVDWPWHGESKGLADTKDLSATTLADALEDFMAALSLPPAFLIGNSVGGFAAARLAITHPQYVRGIVLVNTGGFVDWNFFTRLVCRIIAIQAVARRFFPFWVPRYMVASTPSDEDIARRAAARAKTAGGAAVVAAIWRSFADEGYDLRSQAKDIKVPALITWGMKDPTFPANAGEIAKKYIPRSRLELFQTGHVVFASQPDGFLQAVLPFFESASQTAG